MRDLLVSRKTGFITFFGGIIFTLLYVLMFFVSLGLVILFAWAVFIMPVEFSKWTEDSFMPISFWQLILLVFVIFPLGISFLYTKITGK